VSPAYAYPNKQTNYQTNYQGPRSINQSVRPIALLASRSLAHSPSGTHAPNKQQPNKQTNKQPSHPSHPTTRTPPRRSLAPKARAFLSPDSRTRTHAPLLAPVPASDVRPRSACLPACLPASERSGPRAQLRHSERPRAVCWAAQEGPRKVRRARAASLRMSSGVFRPPGYGVSFRLSIACSFAEVLD